LEVRWALRAALKQKGPVFLRLGKKGEPVVHQKEVPFEIGKGIVLKEGTDVCLLSTGVMLPDAMKIADLLSAKKISATVVSFHTVKPLDTNLLKNAFAKHKLVASLEEHTMLGGLGSAICEWVVQNPSAKAKFKFFGTQDQFLHEACELDYAREKFGLGNQQMVDSIVKSLGGAA
jgi:transketolase